MAKYRKKPVVVDAEQFFTEKNPWPNDCDVTGKRCITGMCPAGPHIHTLEGSLKVSEGDWIITGVKGELYPCKPDIFEQTYEKP